jgi:deoxyguanosine kinase
MAESAGGSRTIYMAIEGVIGVGKTTLARSIQSAFNAQLLLEVFEENPFLSNFYADRAKYAFQTQIFFLLSRYRQQHQVIQRLLRAASVVSDYTFAKDRIFAHLNLQGDELNTYEHLYSALAENVVTPDLVIYLHADIPIVMQRIAVRDRTYERGMDTDYISDLSRAYEDFFAGYTEAPVLRINTNDLDFVRRPQDLLEVIQRIRSALGQGTHQPALPRFAAPSWGAREATLATERRRLTDLQQWHHLVDIEVGVQGNPFYNLICFQHKVGGLAGQLAETWTLGDSLTEQYGNREEGIAEAVRRSRDTLQKELVECLSCILRLANRLGVDLESAYLLHMRDNAIDAQASQERLS